MSAILIIIQLIIWLGIGMWVVDEFEINSTILQIVVFGVTGILSAGIISFLGVKLGVIKPSV